MVEKWFGGETKEMRRIFAFLLAIIIIGMGLFIVNTSLAPGALTPLFADLQVRIIAFFGDAGNWFRLALPQVFVTAVIVGFFAYTIHKGYIWHRFSGISWLKDKTGGTVVVSDTTRPATAGELKVVEKEGS